MGTSKHESYLRASKLYLRKIFDLKADFDQESTTKQIVANISFQSASAWTLVFAIIIASVGLHTNSAAVIIGAMLISPLMGPIVGAGYALGIFDFQLLKRCVRNVFLAAIISITVSAVYFAVAPTLEVQSELLGRIRPTFFDVLIAFFGGAAGIVAISRKERGNAVPGVAIATALMPPLCTAGYGLGAGQLSFFVGAIFLFMINAVFICIATFLVVRYLKFKKADMQTTPEAQTLVHRWIAAAAMAMIIPSVVMAWLLQRETTFESRARAFIEAEVRFPDAYLADRKIQYSFRKPKIELTLIGDRLTQEELKALNGALSRHRLEGTELNVVQPSLAEALEKRLRASADATQKETARIEIDLRATQARLNQLEGLSKLEQDTLEELRTLESRIVGVSFGMRSISESQPVKDVLVVWKTRPSNSQSGRITAFLSKRLDFPELSVSHVQQAR